MMLLRKLWRVVPLVLAVSGCREASGPAALSGIAVVIAPSTITVGKTAKAVAAGLDQEGRTFPIGPVSWASASTTVADVAADGTVTGKAGGIVKITATSEGVSGFAFLTVGVLPTVKIGGESPPRAVPIAIRPSSR